MRQIILDTETTGLDPAQGHRIIEIGCVEIVNRRVTKQHFHQYINPQRAIDAGAQAVHGISNEILKDKPVFASIVDDFMAFIKGAEIIIHNAPFDVGFLNSELALLGDRYGAFTNHCSITDTLSMARKKFPGQKNNLDALCKRLNVDNSRRDLHGALLDAEILADVYLLMTGGQARLSLDAEALPQGGEQTQRKTLRAERPRARVIAANADELAAHKVSIAAINKASSGKCVWNEKG